MVENSSIQKENKTGLKDTLDSIFKLAILLAIVYVIWFLLKPNASTKIDNTYKKDIDSLTKVIENVEKKQEILYQEIKNLNDDISQTDVKISNIKQQKTIVKQIYHEKINAVDTYNDAELDSIFAKRYYYPN
jgi:septal ring factor EnvC (AmiA/AmiB activator)